MKASDFVKKFGWDEVIRVVSQALKSDCAYSLDLEVYLDRYAFSKYEVYIDDLKRLAESHELVESYGGLFEAKIYVDSEYRSLSAQQITKRLKQAIADVEGCL